MVSRYRRSWRGPPQSHPASGGVIGDGRVVRARSGLHTGPSDQDGTPSRANGYCVATVGAVGGAVVPLGPQLRASGGAVGHSCVVVATTGPCVAGAGDEDRAPVPADGERVSRIALVSGIVVTCRPHLRAGSGVIGHRGVVQAGAAAIAFPGDEHPASLWTDGYRIGLVEAITRALVACRPEPGAGDGVIGHGDIGVSPVPSVEQDTLTGDEHPRPVRALRLPTTHRFRCRVPPTAGRRERRPRGPCLPTAFSPGDRP